MSLAVAGLIGCWQLSNEEIQEFCEVKMGSKSSIMALQRKLTRLAELKYIRRELPAQLCESNFRDN